MSSLSNYDIAHNVFEKHMEDILIYTFGSIKNRYGVDFRELYKKEIDLLDANFSFYCDVLLELEIVITGDMLYGWLVDELFRGFGNIKYLMMIKRISNNMADEIMKEVQDGQ